MISNQLKIWLTLGTCLIFTYLFMRQMSGEVSRLNTLLVSSKFRFNTNAIKASFKGAPAAPPENLSPHILEDFIADPIETDQWCADYYGPNYLNYSAAHHVPYCHAETSHSTLECFHTQFLDPFCVAQGVILDRSRINHTDDTTKDFGLHCDLRDWKVENKKEGLEGFKNIPDMPDYFYWTGARRQLETWDISADEENYIGDKECTASNNDNRYTLLVRREGNNNIWHKIMEMWQTMLTLDILHIAIDHKTSKPFLSPDTQIDVVFEDNDDGPVDDLWNEWWRDNPIIRKASIKEPTCMSNVILALPGSSSPFWQSHWANRDCRETFLLNGLLKRFYRHLKMDPPKVRVTEKTTVTIVDRKKSRKIYDIEGHVARLKRRWPDIDVQAIDFAQLPLKEQIKTIHNTDVLVGVIGAGLTHILFMPPESSIAEIMSIKRVDYSGFRNLAKMRGLNYVSAHGKNASDWEDMGYKADAVEMGTYREMLRLKSEAAKGEKKRESRETVAEERKREPVQYNGPEEFEAMESDDIWEGGRRRKREDWQSGEHVYIEADLFQSLVDAAINAQLNRGTRRTDVVPA